ncbi:Cyclin-U4-1 [Porphyridium purpureum]|uniref:Cyclin-U4-1 n=1 Tax=Porphyridium purpureum TaxID=35688 RepID=A0A5J4YXN5_PORPP|nr:Cyclin-U4-1 [Porphyridium purpureum]|eukprot:POR2005..scf209_3
MASTQRSASGGSVLGKRMVEESFGDATMSPIKDLHISEMVHTQIKKARWGHAEPGSLSPLSEHSSWDVVSPAPLFQRGASLETVGDMVFLEDVDECDTECLVSCIAEHLEAELDVSRLQQLDKRQPSATDPDIIFYSAQKQKFALVKYIQRVVTLVSGSSSIFILALCFLQRARKADTLLALHDYNVHRLWITAVVLASKMLEDEVYSNEHYAKMGGVPSLVEMNRLEAQLLKKLNFSLCVPETEYLEMRARVLAY